MPSYFLDSEEKVRNVLLQKGSLVVVNFCTKWGPQCTQVTDAITALANEVDNSDVTFVTVDAESVDTFAREKEVTSVPVVIFFKDGVELNRVRGINIPEIVRLTKDLRTKSVATADNGMDVNSRLKGLINRAPIMLFMKGNSSVPRCGFSRKMIELLQGVGATFDTFDILEDEEVRQGLKTYSNWPTYPQLYVKGEFVGGLDIVKELADSGELADTLKG